MISRILNTFGREDDAAAPIETEPGVRIYVVGDIHGRADLLAQLHQQVARDAAAAPPNVRCRVVYLGDYVDRGPDSSAVLDILTAPPALPLEQVFLRGNHDDLMLRYLDDPLIGADWMSVGGEATLLSYGVRVDPRLPVGRRHVLASDELSARLPPEHRTFLETLELMHVSGGYVFVHAGIRPGVPLDAQKASDLMWIREPFLAGRGASGCVVVHGHSMSAAPVMRRHRIGIDTGAFATGRLTCLVLERETRRFLTGSG